MRRALAVVVASSLWALACTGGDDDDSGGGGGSSSSGGTSSSSGSSGASGSSSGTSGGSSGTSGGSSGTSGGSSGTSGGSSGTSGGSSGTSGGSSGTSGGSSGTSGGSSGTSGTSGATSTAPRTQCEPDAVGTGSSSSTTASSAAGGSSGSPSCSDDTYEPNNAAADAKPLTLTGTSGTFSLTTCQGGAGVDWFKFPVAADKGVTVAINFVHATSDLDLYIYHAADAASGVSADSSAGFTDDETVYMNTTAAEDVYVRVNNYGNATSTYTMTVTIGDPVCLPDFGEEDDTEAAANTFALTDGWLTGRTACAGDPDYYEYTSAIGGTTTSFLVAHAAPAGAVSVTVTEPCPATDAGPCNNANLATTTHGARGETVTFNATAAHTYMVQVRYTGAASGAAYGIVDLTGGLCADDADEDDDTEATAVAVMGTSVTYRTLCGRDPDYHSFTAASAGAATVNVLYEDNGFDVTALAFTAGGETTNPAGTSGAYDPVLGGKTMTFNVTQGTVYYVKVFLPGGEGQVPDYDLQLAGSAFCEADADELNNDLASATTWGTTTGNPPSRSGRTLCGADQDFYALVLPSSLSGAGFAVRAGSTNGDVGLEILDSAGATVTSTEDRTATSVTRTFTLASGTSYVVRVFLRSGDEGGYTLTFLPPPPANDTCANAQAISTFPATITGDTTQAASDYTFNRACTGYENRGPDVIYTVTVPAGQTLTASLDPLDFQDAALWLVEDCVSLCCWAGVDRSASGVETLVWTNPLSQAATLFLGVDGYTQNEYGAYSLTVDVQ